MELVWSWIDQYFVRKKRTCLLIWYNEKLIKSHLYITWKSLVFLWSTSELNLSSLKKKEFENMIKAMLLCHSIKEKVSVPQDGLSVFHSQGYHPSQEHLCLSSLSPGYCYLDLSNQWKEVVMIITCSPIQALPSRVQSSTDQILHAAQNQWMVEMEAILIWEWARGCWQLDTNP